MYNDFSLINGVNVIQLSAAQAPDLMHIFPKPEVHPRDQQTLTVIIYCLLKRAAVIYTQ